MLLYGIIISLTITFLVLLIINLIQTGQHSSFIKKRITQIQRKTEKISPQDAVLSPLTDIASIKLESLINKFVPQNIIKNIEKKIATAKLENMDVAKYFLIKIIIDLFVLIVIPIYFAILKMHLNFGIIAVLLIIGFIFPDLLLKSKIEKRYKAIVQELPNYIDLLRVCIDAGMDMEGALNKIVINSKGLLQDETTQTVNEIKMGKSLGEALQDMAERLNYADFSASTFRQNLRGYMFQRRPLYPAILFKRPVSIHMFFVNFPLAILVLDKKYTVLDKFIIKPWRVSGFYPQAEYFLEIPQLAKIKTIKIGDRLKLKIINS